MKKLIFIVVGVVIVAGTAWASSPPTNVSAVIDNRATVTVDNQHTGLWDTLGSISAALDDTCYAIWTWRGTVTLWPGQKLYAGLVCSTLDDPIAAATVRVVPNDTLILEWHADAKNSHTFDFAVWYMDSLVTQTDTTKKVYAIAAVKGSTDQEKVVITNFRMSLGVSDQDDLTDTNND